MSSISCPKCGRTIAIAAGANQAQCFGCGTVVNLGHQKQTELSSKGNSRLIVAIATAATGLLIICGLVIGLWVFASGDSSGEIASANPVNSSAGSSSKASESTDTGASPSSETEPAIVATEEQIRRAGRVDASVRQQIIQMYDQMVGTTRKKIPLQKGTILRTRTEGMFSEIEKRELRRIAVLFDLDDADVEAVIQVELANRQ